jgi:hypothetical protein
MNTISRFKFVTCFVRTCRLQAKILCEINEVVMKLQYTISQRMFHTNYGRNIKHSATDIFTFLKKHTTTMANVSSTQHQHAAVSGSRYLPCSTRYARYYLYMPISLGHHVINCRGRGYLHTVAKGNLTR